MSASTIDRVLNGRSRVRDETSRRVLQAAEQIGFYATPLLRQRLKADVPHRTFGFLLQQKSTAFYRILGEALTAATQNATSVRATAVIQFMEDLAPAAVAENLLRLGESCDAVAVVAADHPQVTAAINQLRARQVPVVALISDLTATSRAAYVGLDNRQAGRTAGWLLSKMERRPGPIAMMVGSHRYLCQETCEIGFRAYLREHMPGVAVLDTLTTLESDRYAYEITLDLLKRAPDLSGLYLSGGGVGGVLRALGEHRTEKPFVMICHDRPREALVEGIALMVIADPIELLSARAVEVMIHSCQDTLALDHPTQNIVPFNLLTPENL